MPPKPSETCGVCGRPKTGANAYPRHSRVTGRVTIDCLSCRRERARPNKTPMPGRGRPRSGEVSPRTAFRAEVRAAEREAERALRELREWVQTERAKW